LENPEYDVHQKKLKPSDQIDEPSDPQNKDLSSIRARMVPGETTITYKLRENIDKEVSYCPTLNGQEPEQFKGENAEKELLGRIADWCKGQKPMVILGNDMEDIHWITNCLSLKQVTNIIVYDGSKEAEKNLETYLKTQDGVLITLADLFSGMECSTVAYAYNNPYPRFRCAFLRAVNHLILLDRNDSTISIPNLKSGVGITAIALYDYQAMAEDEISYDPNDIISNIETSPEVKMSNVINQR